MSAQVIPWPARTAGAKSKPVPVLIDRQVPVRSLRKALAVAGLQMDHDPTTGLLYISSGSSWRAHEPDRATLR